MIAERAIAKTVCDVILNSRIRLLLYKHMPYFLLEYLMLEKNRPEDRAPYVDMLYNKLVIDTEFEPIAAGEEENRLNHYKFAAYVTAIPKGKDDKFDDMITADKPNLDDHPDHPKNDTHLKNYIDSILKENIEILKALQKCPKGYLLNQNGRCEITEGKTTTIIAGQSYSEYLSEKLITLGEKENYFKDFYSKKYDNPPVDRPSIKFEEGQEEKYLLAIHKYLDEFIRQMSR
jgi:hypothetical protein